jgi:peptide/nickel transport system permease protein
VAAITCGAAVICAALVCYAPAATVDERELDTRLNERSLARIRAEKAAHGNLVLSLREYFSGLTHGDLGYSTSRNQSIRSLIAESAPATVRSAGLGLLGAWMLGLLLAAPLGRIWKSVSAVTAAVLLSIPVALVAYLSLVFGGAAELVFIVALAPKVFRYASNIFAECYAAPHLEAAKSLGISEGRILVRHVLPGAARPLLALAATSVALAIGAAIPIETVCDVSGLGRLAWQAAMARDLPLLVNLTAVVALVTTVATTAAEALA